MTEAGQALLHAGRTALTTLRRNWPRSFFMMLGITVGIAAASALSAVGEATKRETMARFRNMIGSFDVVLIQPGASRTRGMPALETVEPSITPADVAAVASEVPNVDQVSGMQYSRSVDVRYQGETATPSVIGVSHNWLDIRKHDVIAGSGVLPEDEASLARIAIIGLDVRNTLFKGEDPLGRTIQIGGVPFRVQGVLATRGVTPDGDSLDDTILVPLTTASRRLSNRDYLTSVLVQLRDPGAADRTIADITALLRERHRLAASAESDFTVANPRAQLAQITAVGSMLSVIVRGIAWIGILIGGVVIMNLMLAAVAERRREIGLRRAVGATRGDIFTQFLFEAVAVAVLGGAVGAVLGIGVASVAIAAAKLPAAPVAGALMISLAVSVTIGVAFGVHPAWKAARLEPVDALRG
jgi:putative ABC transport system permease protein